MSNRWNKFQDGIHRSFPPVPIAPVRALGVVVNQPLVQILLKRLYALVEVFPEGNAEEFVQDRLIEALNKAVGLRRFHFGSAVFNIIQSKVKLKGMILGPAEFPPVVGENGADDQAVLPVERQDVVVNKSGGAFRLLAGMQKPECIGTVGVYAGMQIHLSDAFQTAHEHGILA